LNATAASVLGFLNAFGSMTAYDLMAAVEDVIGDFWHVTKSQVYRELKLLAQLGFVDTLAIGARDKQPYAITPSGRDAFRAWIGQRPTPPVMRMPIVLEVFFGADVPFDVLRRHVDEIRAHHADRLRVYETFAPQAKGTWPGQALRLGFMFQQAMIDWLDSLPKEPLPAPSTSRKKTSRSKSKRSTNG
jgi:DNA-binding PadR family transcriptional regulator